MKDSIQRFSKIFNENLSIPDKNKKIIVAVGLGILVIFALLALPALVELASWRRLGADWRSVFRPALEHLLAGRSPYSEEHFYSPPWVLIFYAPFALLPEPYGLVAIWLANFAAFGYAAHKHGAKPITIALFLTLPQVFQGAFLGNCDWMVALGTVLPPWLGLLLVTVKPQIGAPIALFILIEAYRQVGVRKAAITAAPLLVLSGITLLLWRDNLLQGAHAAGMFWNVAHFPYLMPVGLVLLYRAVRDRKLGWSIASGPFLTPYLGNPSLPVAALGLLSSQVETLLAVLGLWIAWLMQ